MSKHETNKTNFSLPPLGEDSNDEFSLTISTDELKTTSGIVVGQKVVKRRRANPTKPGRTLGVAYDTRVAVGKDFRDLSYIYTMRFTAQPGKEADPAGQHYHHEKNELFTSSVGRFLVVLEDRDTSEQIRIQIDDNTRDESGNELETSIYVPAGVVHAVKPLNVGRSALLVLADYPNGHGDEVAYPMNISA